MHCPTCHKITVNPKVCQSCLCRKRERSQKSNRDRFPLLEWLGTAVDRVTIQTRPIAERLASVSPSLCGVTCYYLPPSSPTLTNEECHALTRRPGEAVLGAIRWAKGSCSILCLLSDIATRKPLLRLRKSICTYALTLDSADLLTTRRALLDLLKSEKGTIYADTLADCDSIQRSLHQQYHEYMSTWRDHHVLQQRLRIVEELYAEQGLSDLTYRHLPPIWKDAHGSKLPRLLKTDHVWPGCPSTTRLQALIQTASSIPDGAKQLDGTVYSISFVLGFLSTNNSRSP